MLGGGEGATRPGRAGSELREVAEERRGELSMCPPHQLNWLLIFLLPLLLL